MKHIYFLIALLIAPLTQTFSQDELIENQSFDSGITDWSAGNSNSTVAYDQNTDHTGNNGGSVLLTTTAQGNGHIKSSQIAATSFSAGTHVLTFWVYGSTGDRVKARLTQGDGDGGTTDTDLVFSENLACNGNPCTDVPTITKIQSNNTWQKVTTTVDLIKQWAMIKIFNGKNDTTINIDDISLKRQVSEMPASGDFSSGWYPKNATSTIDPTTGVHNLLMNNANPQLESLDLSIDADVNKFITVEIKNNSTNDRLTIFHPKSSDPTKKRYVTLPITTNDVTTKTYEFNMTGGDWSGTISPLTLYVRKWDPNGGNNGARANVAAEQGGDVEFHSITTSLTASFSEYYQPKVSIYPNPSDRYFVVENSVLNDNLEIYNVVGKLIKTQTIKSANEKINIEKLNRGIYFVRVNDREAVRLIKK